jgi:outer membrane protein OmpA-like peptidoglycan-associated protein
MMGSQTIRATFTLCALSIMTLAISGCATTKRDLDFERLSAQWIDVNTERTRAPELAQDVDQSLAQWKVAQSKSEREQLAFLVEKKIAVFQAGVALANDQARLSALLLEKRDLELAAARLQAEAAQLEAERLRFQNIVQAEAAERALADARASAQAQTDAAELERARQEQLTILAQTQASAARELAAAQARETELAKAEALLRGDQVAALERQVAGLREQSTARGKALILGDVFFASNQGSLSNAGKANLAPALKFLARYPNLPVSVEGHSDGRGAAAGNLKISQNRADSVRTALIKLGVDSARLKAIGFGETQPVTSNDTDAGRAKNRRVEIIIEGAK